MNYILSSFLVGFLVLVGIFGIILMLIDFAKMLLGKPSRGITLAIAIIIGFCVACLGVGMVIIDFYGGTL